MSRLVFLFALLLVNLSPVSLLAQQGPGPRPTAPEGADARRLKRVVAAIEFEQDGQSLGSVKFRLFPDKAPVSVETFVGLAEGTKKFREHNESKGKLGDWVTRPYYDGLTLHKIVPGFIIQGGCPFGTGRGDPGFTIQDEIAPDLSHDGEGYLSIANRKPKTRSGTMQFFVTLKENKEALDGNYTIFGKVIDGMDVIRSIAKIKVHPVTGTPLKPVVIKKVVISKEYLP